MARVHSDMALPRTRLGKISKRMTQLSGASVSVNGAGGQKDRSQGDRRRHRIGESRNISTWPAAMPIVPTDPGSAAAELGGKPESDHGAERDPGVHVDAIEDRIGTAMLIPASMNSVGV